MSSDTATGVLRDEHQLILQVVAVLERILGRDGAADRAGAGECVAFFRLFVDACHHGKEEGLLFPELEAQGMPVASGPIGVMLEEHRQGRALVAGMAAALDAFDRKAEGAWEQFLDPARAYIDLIRQHIGKEDGILFQMADGMVHGPRCRALCDAYGESEACPFEGRTKAQLESMASALMERYPA